MLSGKACFSITQQFTEQLREIIPASRFFNEICSLKKE